MYEYRYMIGHKSFKGQNNRYRAPAKANYNDNNITYYNL